MKDNWKNINKLFYLIKHLLNNTLIKKKSIKMIFHQGPDLARSFCHPQNLLIESVSSKLIEPFLRWKKKKYSNKQIYKNFSFNIKRFW